MSAAKIKVLWISPGFASDEADTSCIPPLQDLAEHFRDAGIDLHIFSLHYPFRHQRYDWNGIKLYSCGFPNLKGLRKWKYLPKCYALLKKYMQQEKFDVIHSFWLGETTFLAAHLASVFQVKHVATAMGQDSMGTSFLPWSNLKKSSIAVLTDYAASFLQPKLRNPVHVIPFGVSEHWIASPSERRYHFLFASSLIPLKNPEVFIRACASLKSALPDLKVLMVGEQPSPAYAEQIKKLISECGLNDHLEITDKVPRRQLMHGMASSCVLVHPSTFESQGMVMLEALMNGCKVVSCGAGWKTRQQGFWESSPEQLPETMLSALKAPGPAEMQFSIEDCFQAYLNLYFPDDEV